jgi:hypothetical protein
MAERSLRNVTTSKLAFLNVSASIGASFDGLASRLTFW